MLPHWLFDFAKTNNCASTQPISQNAFTSFPSQMTQHFQAAIFSMRGTPALETVALTVDLLTWLAYGHGARKVCRFFATLRHIRVGNLCTTRSSPLTCIVSQLECWSPEVARKNTIFRLHYALSPVPRPRGYVTVHLVWSVQQASHDANMPEIACTTCRHKGRILLQVADRQ